MKSLLIGFEDNSQVDELKNNVWNVYYCCISYLQEWSSLLNELKCLSWTLLEHTPEWDEVEGSWGMSPPTYHRLTLMKQSCFMKSPLSRSIHQERLDSGVLLQPLQMSTGQKWPHILRKAMFHLKTCLLYASLPCAFLAQMPLSSAFFPSWLILGLKRETAWDWTP